MMRIQEIAGLIAVLTACAGPPAGGQVGPSANDPLARPNLHEVPNEQVAPSVQPAFIEVSGSGSVTVAPDRAIVSFAMETRASAANDAAAANATAMDAVLAAVRRGAFPELKIETFGYSLRPEYSANSNAQRAREIVAYTALNNVRATTSDVTAVGRLIDVAISAGANRVSSIAFDASDTDAARAQALAEAVSSARTEATVIAESLGYRLGPPIEVHGGAQRPVPIFAQAEMRAFASAQAAPTPIEAGDQTVTASVTIRFALGPEMGGR
jgi:uncharacterized protein YggE